MANVNKFVKGDILRPLSSKKSSKYFEITKLKKVKVLKVIRNDNDINNPIIEVKILEGSATRPGLNDSTWNNSRPYTERDYKKVTKGHKVKLLSNSFILFDDIEKDVSFKEDDILKPNGFAKTSKGYTLEHIKKVKVINIYDYPRKEMDVKILDGYSIRQSTYTYRYNNAIKGSIIRVFVDSFVKLIDKNNRLTYSIF